MLLMRLINSNKKTTCKKLLKKVLVGVRRGFQYIKKELTTS